MRYLQISQIKFQEHLHRYISLILTKQLKKKIRWKLHKDAVCCFKQILKVEPYKTAIVQPYKELTKSDDH